MYFPVDLVISHINASTFPTKTSLKKYIEENMQVGYVTKITFISATKRDMYDKDFRFDISRSGIPEGKPEEGMEDFTTDIPHQWTGIATIVRYRAIIELEWDFSKEWNIDINKIPKYSCTPNYHDNINRQMQHPSDWYQYYIEDNKDFMDISIKDRTQNPLPLAKYLYDKIEKQKETESELKSHIENLLCDKFETAARIHILERQIQQMSEKGFVGFLFLLFFLLSYIIGKTK